MLVLRIDERCKKRMLTQKGGGTLEGGRAVGKEMLGKYGLTDYIYS
jgi:hypothetical protein